MRSLHLQCALLLAVIVTNHYLNVSLLVSHNKPLADHLNLEMH